jgi:hypothetical protein
MNRSILEYLLAILISLMVGTMIVSMTRCQAIRTCHLEAVSAWDILKPAKIWKGAIRYQGAGGLDHTIIVYENPAGKVYVKDGGNSLWLGNPDVKQWDVLRIAKEYDNRALRAWWDEDFR